VWQPDARRHKLIEGQLALRRPRWRCIERDDLDVPAQKWAQGRNRKCNGFINRGVDLDRVHVHPHRAVMPLWGRRAFHSISQPYAAQRSITMLGPLATLAPTIRDLAPTIRELAPTIRELAPTIRELAPTIGDLAPTIRPLTPAIRDLAPAVRDLAPTIGDARPCGHLHRLQIAL
jgi:hypothetical protein